MNTRFFGWSLCLSVLAGVGPAHAADDAVLRVPAGLKPFEYMESPGPLPNYVPNAKWGTQAEPIRTMQKPLSPMESLQHLAVFPEFQVNLVAAEPEIVKPIWLAWDERGRLWIAETLDYPNSMQPPGQGRDRLKICEDTNGDGQADKFTVFADQLSVPTSFVFANGGVIVVHSGKTEFLKDTNGDDRADERRVLFSGWGTEDTHAGPSNLRYGFDGWIWGTVGYSGFRGTVGGKELRFGQGLYRFKPDGSALEFVRSSNNNTWGLGLSEDNIVFGSTANGNASMYLPIPNRYYERVNGWSASRLETIADSQRFYPLTDKVRQVDYHNRYTAGAGSAIYTARQFPAEYWNKAQFVAEPTGHLLGLFKLSAQGADFSAHNAKNFLASDDEWTSPIAAEVGPDGALWVIDWYNYIIQHNPTPQGFKNGKGNAYETPLRDQTHGRIYRVAAKSRPLSQPQTLQGAPAAKLVEALRSDNMLWRMHAQRLLVEGGHREAIPALCALARSKKLDEIGLNPAAIHALWTLHGLGAFESDRQARRTANAVVEHPSAGVRRAAAMVLPRDGTARKALLPLLEDSDAQVRLAALLTLSELPADEVSGRAIYHMLQAKVNAEDRWIPDAATAAAAKNDLSFLEAALTDRNSQASASGELPRVVRLVTGHYAQRVPVDSVLQLLSRLKGASDAVAATLLDGLVAGWPEGKAPALTAADKRQLAQLMDAAPESARDRLLALAQKWGQSEIFGANVADILAGLKSKLADATAAADVRTSAARRLLALEGGRESVPLVLGQVTLLSPPETARGFVNALAESRDRQTGEAVLASWDRLTPAARRSAIAVLLRRPEWTGSLLEGVEKRKIQRTDIAVEQWSQLKQHPNRAIAGRAERLSGSYATVSSDREEVVKKLLPIAGKPGDLARGKEVYATTCAVCHTFNGQGGKVGPDLTGIAPKSTQEILIDIIDPNRSVEANYRMWNVTTKSGDTFSGRLETETQSSVEILDTTGQKHVVQRQDIESMQGSTASIMPAGFEALPEADLAALLTYLTQPH